MPSISNLIPSLPLFTLSLLFLVTENYVRAKDFMVGDDGGWSQGVNYLHWSQKYNFTVGDVLVFSYVKGQHNVYQVTEDTYRSCDSSSGVKAIYDTGNDRVTLKDAAQYWFICNINGHCKGGMRFGIKVENASMADAPLAPPLHTFAPPAPVGNGAGRGMGWRTKWVWGGHCVWVLVFCITYFDHYYWRVFVGKILNILST